MIEIIRLTHRLPRDTRTTTHCALVARAFGAQAFVYSGRKDSGLEKAINKVTEQFGGPFFISYEKNIIAYLKRRKQEGYTLIHLTMYGLQIQNEIAKIRSSKKLIIIIGSERVEPQIYQLADFNISVTNQPHSEVMALGYTLDYYFNRKGLTSTFTNAKKEVIPKQKGKLLKTISQE